MSMKMDNHSNDRESLTTRYRIAANAGFLRRLRLPPERGKRRYFLKN